MRRTRPALLLPALLAALACGSSDPAADTGGGDTPVPLDVEFGDADVAVPGDATDLAGTDGTAPDAVGDAVPDAAPCTAPVSPSGFQDNCDGTVRDTNTGLVWEKAYHSPNSLDDARAACDASQTGGFEDWRLPTIDELRTLILGCPKTARGGACPIVHETNGSCDPYGINSTCPVPGDCNGCGTGGGPVEKPGDPTKKCYLDATFDWQCSALFWSNSQVKAQFAKDLRSWYVTFWDAAINTWVSGSAVTGVMAARCVRGP